MKMFMAGLFSLIFISSSAFAIRDGDYAHEKNNPNIYRIDLDNNVCTGVRVSQKTLITVSHCFKDNPKKIRVIKRKSLLKSNRYKIDMKDVYFHAIEKYKELALITVEFESPYVQSFKINEDSLASFEKGEAFQILGYGMDRSLDSLGYFREGEINFERLYKFYDQPMILAKMGERNHLPCPGDSGGPLFTNRNGVKELVGVVSFISNGKKPSKSKVSVEKKCSEAKLAAYVPLSVHIEDIKNQFK